MLIPVMQIARPADAVCLYRVKSPGLDSALISFQRSPPMAISKDQLVTDLAESTDVSKATVRALLEQLGEIVSDALEHGEELTLPGIGKLKVDQRPARTGRNPQTGATLQIAAKKVVKFVPAKALTDAINS